MRITKIERRILEGLNEGKKLLVSWGRPGRWTGDGIIWGTYRLTAGMYDVRDWDCLPVRTVRSLAKRGLITFSDDLDILLRERERSWNTGGRLTEEGRAIL